MFNSNRHGCRFLDYSVEGNRFLSLENNIFKMTFWLNKGADLIEIRHKALDIDVMWRTPMPMPQSGLYIPPHTGAIGSFFDYYPGGWQEVFPNAHLPVSDYKNAPLGLHGEVCLLPWTYEVLENQEEIIRIKLSVRTARTPFRLDKVITLKKDDAFCQFEETIKNEGNEEMQYNWGHHPVFGAPFIDSDCVIDVPEKSIAVIPAATYSGTEKLARNQRALWPVLKSVEGKEVDASHILGPDAQCADSYHLEIQEGWAGIRNPKLNLGIGLAWELKTFPYLWIWQAYCGSPGYPFYSSNYNVAIEPYSVPVETLSESIVNGHAHLIKAGDTHMTKFLFGFTQGHKPIRKITLDGQFIH